MLQVFNSLFKSLHAKNIIFCNWKDHHAVADHLNGIGDLDLYVPISQKVQFEDIVKKEGFRRVLSYQSSHSYIEHYYGLDKANSIFVHLHVYFKIITGEHVSKNYDLPLERYLTQNIETSSELPTLNSSAQRSIFLIRYFLKIGSVYGLMQYFRELEKYSKEWNYLADDFNYESIPELGMSIEEFKKLNQAYDSSPFIKKFYLSMKFKRKLKRFKRRGFVKYQIFIINNFFVRLLNKLFLKKQKIFIPGTLVAVCGLDGSGKSSLVTSLQANFSSHFCTKVFHLGRPSSNLVTFFFNFFISVYSFLKRLKFSTKKSHTGMSSKNVSLIYALRSVLLAYDRKIQSKQAFDYSRKGYLVICDRYPGLENGKMDSPRIPANKSRGALYQSCYNLEQKLYRSIQHAEFIFQLSVPLEVAILRNSLRTKFGKETEAEIKDRFAVNSGAKFLGESYHIVDATPSSEKVYNRVADELWHSEDWG